MHMRIVINEGSSDCIALLCTRVCARDACRRGSCSYVSLYQKGSEITPSTWPVDEHGKSMAGRRWEIANPDEPTQRPSEGREIEGNVSLARALCPTEPDVTHLRFGSEWYKVDTVPAGGVEFVNVPFGDALSSADLSWRSFSRAELAEFGLHAFDNLLAHSFVATRGVYYLPKRSIERSFTAEQWSAFGVGELYSSSYVRAENNYYYRPAADRTQDESTLFKKGLGSLSEFYAHRRTIVLKLTGMPSDFPSAFTYPPGSSPNTATYFERGW